MLVSLSVKFVIKRIFGFTQKSESQDNGDRQTFRFSMLSVSRTPRRSFARDAFFVIFFLSALSLIFLSAISFHLPNKSLERVQKTEQIPSFKVLYIVTTSSEFDKKGKKGKVSRLNKKVLPTALETIKSLVGGERGWERWR